jgi:hypothetical protein
LTPSGPDVTVRALDKEAFMRRWLTVRRLLVVGGIAAALAVTPVAVLAATGVFGGTLDRQAGRWTTTPATTSSAAWRDVPRLFVTRCTLRQVTAMVSVTVRGGPVLFRVVIDGVPEAPMKPGLARFVPDGLESFSFTFVGNTAPFEADDTHKFNVQWRSPTGAPITLERGVLNLLFQDGTQGC